MQRARSALLVSRTREGGGATEFTNRTAYRRDSTLPSVYPNPKLILLAKIAIREMAVAAVAAPMVMALGVVADRAETSRWVLLSSSLSPGQTGEQIQTTTNAYTYPRPLVYTRGILALLVGVVEAAPPPSWVLGGFPGNPGNH